MELPGCEIELVLISSIVCCADKVCTTMVCSNGYPVRSRWGQTLFAVHACASLQDN